MKYCATCKIELTENYATMRDDRTLCLNCYNKETAVVKPDKKPHKTHQNK